MVDGSPFTTGAGGIAGIIGLADGNYHYEIYYTETDGVKSQWGWGMNIAVAGTTDFEVTKTTLTIQEIIYQVYHLKLVLLLQLILR